MADTDQERTEEPTSKKLADAAKKGQIARSKDLGTCFVLVFSAIALLMWGGDLGRGMANIMTRALSLRRNETFDTTKMFSIFEKVAEELMGPISIIFFVILIAAFIGNSLLGGFNWSVEAMTAQSQQA